jgi:gliding motility-associated-like protein
VNLLIKKIFNRQILSLISIGSILVPSLSQGQACTTLGQTPSTAFPVCGTTTFTQSSVPLCATNSLFVPGCSGGGANYENRNPFFYRFTCFQSGTLGFVITPLAANEDYDWQLYDITGRNPNDIFTVNSLVVTGNWAGTYGATGASANGINGIQCGSDPASNAPTFAAMPNLIQGREYLLLVSHFTNTQSGYTLSFGGGTAVITDPTDPHLLSAKADCDGTKIRVKLNKKVNCRSLSISGSEFRLLPAARTITNVQPDSCSFGFDFDELELTLSGTLPNGNYQLVIQNGSDGNTLLDNCGRGIPVNEQIPFSFQSPQPIFADSIGKPSCKTDSIRIYFPKRINCASIAANGSDFSISGPTPVTIVAAGGNCLQGKTDYVTVRFAAPIYTSGTYTLRLKPGTDGTVLIDECGQETPTQQLNFNTADTVNAGFNYTERLGCQRDTLTFFHNGLNQVNQWSWIINGNAVSNQQQHTYIFPATSNNTVLLHVSNGTCIDTSIRRIVLNNEVKAGFDMPAVICPEDALVVTNTTKGTVTHWNWQFDVLGSSTRKDPPPFQWPNSGREAFYTVKLSAFNSILGCSDSIRKTLRVLDFCRIAVPTGFTPNNDGLNDRFGPYNALKADDYRFQVYNRWGQLMFHSRNWQEKWDGRWNGQAQPGGVYVWTLTYINPDNKQSVSLKGTVTLIR